jgi:hypothetical protein
MLTQDKVIQAMQKSINKPGSLTLLNRAGNNLLDYIHQIQHSQIDLYKLDQLCSRTMALSEKYYDIVSDHLSQSPSHDEEDGWIKVSGFTVLVENIQEYAAYIPIPEIDREKLKQQILEKSGFKGDVKFSSFGMLFPAGESSLHSIAASLAIEEKTENSATIEGSLFTLPIPKINAQLMLCMYIKLPFTHANDVHDWKDFDEKYATEIEIMHLRHDIYLSIPSLSETPARFISSNELLFELGEILLREVGNHFDDLVIGKLNNKERTDAKIDFVLTLVEVDEDSLPFTKINVQLKNGEELLAEMPLVETYSPAFILGHLNMLVSTLIRPGCKMNVIDMRHH